MTEPTIKIMDIPPPYHILVNRDGSGWGATELGSEYLNLILGSGIAAVCFTTEYIEMSRREGVELSPIEAVAHIAMRKLQTDLWKATR